MRDVTHAYTQTKQRKGSWEEEMWTMASETLNWMKLQVCTCVWCVCVCGVFMCVCVCVCVRDRAHGVRDSKLDETTNVYVCMVCVCVWGVCVCKCVPVCV